MFFFLPFQLLDCGRNEEKKFVGYEIVIILHASLVTDWKRITKETLIKEYRLKYRTHFLKRERERYKRRENL
jgi:hypothetical protein